MGEIVKEQLNVRTKVYTTPGKLFLANLKKDRPKGNESYMTFAMEIRFSFTPTSLD